MTLIGWLLLWAVCSVLVALLWASACGTGDYDDDEMGRRL